jgi:hypothetical protein
MVFLRIEIAKKQMQAMESTTWVSLRSYHTKTLPNPSYKGRGLRTARSVSVFMELSTKENQWKHFV